jgi:hypothetical protein
MEEATAPSTLRKEVQITRYMGKQVLLALMFLHGLLRALPSFLLNLTRIIGQNGN